jgi:formylglycine-generating enzyme required for sulfatase activity
MLLVLLVGCQGAKAAHHVGEAKLMPIDAKMLSPYAIQDHPVTRAEYVKCVEVMTCAMPKGPFEPETWPDLPVVNVRWRDANAYCKLHGLRLPTEAEWVAAAAVLDDLGKHNEWVADWYDPDFKQRASRDPRGPAVSPQGKRMSRGVEDSESRPWIRREQEPDKPIGTGFRCVQGPPLGPVDDMIEVPAGTIRAGCMPFPSESAPSGYGTVQCDVDDNPQTDVEVSAFEIDRLKVTELEYKACIDNHACAWPEKLAPETTPDDPVEATWDEATAFCKWRGKRIPFGIEWEKAARNGDARRFPWGNEWPDCTRVAYLDATGTRCSSDALGRHPAGASPLGVMDMLSTKGEWTVDGPEGPRYPAYRTVRGAWTVFRDVIASPFHQLPTNRMQFRCAR